MNDELNLANTEILKYSELGIKEKAQLDAYSIYYLKLKSHDSESKEEDIVQTFLRLQEGIPLNKAEKINAHRGVFKDTFRETREDNSFFDQLGREKRFRFRQLAAEMLLIELESDFENKIFPSLDLKSLVGGIKKYEKSISSKKVRFYRGTLDFLYRSLNIILTAFTLREAISFYMLVSYLRKKKADNSNLENEIAEFAIEFLQVLNSFSIYDEKPPKGMDGNLFTTYKTYKQEAKILTTPDSLKNRFNIILSEFQRIKPYIEKDSKRYYDTEQKRTLYFRQKGLCLECGRKMNFKVSSGHHGIAHRKGGRTNDLSNASLLHNQCHQRLEKRLEKLAKD